MKKLFLLLSIFFLASNLHAQELLLNGNFNASSANWVTSCTSVEATYFETTYGGTVGTNRVAEVDDESCFHQDVCVLPGASYVFSMQASRRTSGSPNPLTTHINIVGLDASGATVATYVNMDFTRTNTTFALTAVAGIPTIAVASGSGVVRLRITLSDNTTGYSTLGMIVDNLSLVFVTPPSISGAASVCQNAPATLGVSGIPSTAPDIYYNWTFSGGASPATSSSSTPAVTWSTAGTAIATVTLGNGVCYVDTLTYNIPVAATSVTTIFDTICSGTPVTFNGNVLTASGTYLDTLANINGCDSFITLNLYIKPQPGAPTITGDTFYCQGEAFVPFAVTGSGVLWYTVPTGGVGSATAPVVPTGAPGVYNYYASQVVNGCESARDSIRVVVNITPAAPTVSNVTYCQYTATVPLTAPGTNILWYTSATGGIGSTTAPTPSSAVPGVYTWYVSQTDNTCEGPRAPISATINARPPAPVITNDPGAYCPGQPFNNWTIVLGANILWYTAATGGVGSATAPVPNTSVPGTYTYWASQTVLGCEGDRTAVSVTVYAGVNADYSYNVRKGCHGDTVDFVNNSSGAVVYSWDFGDGTSSTVTNPTHIYPVQDVYTVKLYAHSYTCVDSSVQTIDLRHPNSAAFSIASLLICQGSSTTFTDLSVSSSPTYQWSFGDGYYSNVASPSHTYNVAGIYTVSLIVTDQVPCADTAYAVVTVDSAAGLSMRLSDTTLCQGTYVTMNADYLLTGSIAIVWDLGNSDSVINVDPLVYAYGTTGTFNITTMVRYRACPPLSVSRSVTVMQQPLVSLGADTSICAGSTTVVLADALNVPAPGTSWLWSTGATTPAITVSTDGVYAVKVTVGNCYASDTVVVRNNCYMEFPNVFTPNGDGVNDYFDPRTYLGKGLKSFKMNIYNRWGQMIFETANLEGRGWDGRFNNEPQPEEVYVYTLTAIFSDGQYFTRNGNLTLVR